LRIDCRVFKKGGIIYITLTDKVSIVCSRHGEFKQTPKNHLKGQNCRKFIDEPTSSTGSNGDFRDDNMESQQEYYGKQ